METTTETKRDILGILKARPKPDDSLLDALLSQTDMSEEIAACDRQAQELVERILDMFENG